MGRKKNRERKKQGRKSGIETTVATSYSSDLMAQHLDDFFAHFPEFDYHRTSSSTDEFYRMCDFFEWDRDDDAREEAHDAFKTALVQQFNSLYGTDVDDVESWRGLFHALNIFPHPENRKEAKKVSVELCVY